jgi:hypothetical protein
MATKGKNGNTNREHQLPSFLMFSVCVPILTSSCHHFWCSVCVPILTSSCHHFWCSLFVFSFLPLVVIISGVLCLCSHSYLWLPSFLMFCLCQRTPEIMATRDKNGNTNREHQKWWQLEVRMGTQTENIRNDGVFSVCVPILISGCHNFWCSLFVFPFLPLVAIISDVLCWCSNQR